MKAYGVKNSSIPNSFAPTVRLNYDANTSILYVTVSVASTTGQQELAERTISTEVNINDLRSRYDWCDRQSYALALKGTESGLKFTPPVPLFAETVRDRESPAAYAKRTEQNLLVTINVPFADSTADDVFLTVNLNKNASDADFVCESGIERAWSAFDKTSDEQAATFPRIVASAPETVVAGEVVQAELRIVDAAGGLIGRDATLYIEAVYGMTPGTRVNAVAGVAKLRVSTACMVPGDDVKIKVGWKYYPGVEDVCVRVV